MHIKIYIVCPCTSLMLSCNRCFVRVNISLRGSLKQGCTWMVGRLKELFSCSVRMGPTFLVMRSWFSASVGKGMHCCTRGSAVTRLSLCRSPIVTQSASGVVVGLSEPGLCIGSPKLHGQVSSIGELSGATCIYHLRAVGVAREC